MQEEECSVCYRAFSSQLVPFVLSCGHSFCDACSTLVRSCPLCRHRITAAHPKRTNYSLLSLVQKLQNNSVIERAEQQTQTDELVSSEFSRRSKPDKPSFFAGRNMQVQIKHTGLTFSIK